MISKDMVEWLELMYAVPFKCVWKWVEEWHGTPIKRVQFVSRTVAANARCTYTCAKGCCRYTLYYDEPPAWLVFRVMKWHAESCCSKAIGEGDA